MADESDEVQGRAKGGKARAESLTPERRTAIARKAAAARFSEDAKLPRATHGSTDHPLVIGEIQIPCYVLEDGTRLLSQRGLQKGVGMSTGGGASGEQRLATFAASLAEKAKEFSDISARGTELFEKLRTPIRFKPLAGPPVFGYEATVLADLCDLILAARAKGLLQRQQEHLAEQAEILVRGFARVGIIALVDEATGYQEVRPKDALQQYLEMLVRKELAAWAKRFPDEFYQNIYKLRGWVWPGMQKNRFSIVAHYTRDLVYERLAPALLDELEVKNPRNERGHRKSKFHQWLTEDVGHPMLAQHMHSLIMFQRLAIANGYGWNRFVKMVDAVLPRKGATLELPLPEVD